MRVVHVAAVGATLWILGACITPPGNPQEIHHDDPAGAHLLSETGVTATFETTTAHRDEARAAGIPVLLRGVAVNYPGAAEPETIGNGWVDVQMLINSDGKVGSAQVLRSSNPVFDNAALTAVRSWKFAPLPRPQQYRHRILILAAQPGDHYQPTTSDH